MSNQPNALLDFTTKYFPSGFKGIYVDVGAGHVEHLSNSYQYRKKGWDVVAIEPQPEMCEQFRAQGYPILQYACSYKDEGEIDFEICDFAGGMGGSAFKVLDEQSRIDYKITPIKVQAYTLTTILSKHSPDLDHIDILDIDAEYSELQVLQGLDFEKYSPTVMSVENLPYDTLFHNPHQEEVREFCVNKGYKIAQTIDYNEYWIKK